MRSSNIFFIRLLVNLRGPLPSPSKDGEEVDALFFFYPPLIELAHSGSHFLFLPQRMGGKEEEEEE